MRTGSAVLSATSCPLVKFEESAITEHPTHPAPSSDISELAICRSALLPGDPARTGSVAFWRPDGSAPPGVASGTVTDLTVAQPLCPPSSCRCAPPCRSTVFWGAAALPRSPGAPLVTGGPAYAGSEPVLLPEQRPWAADVAAGHDAGVRLPPRIEADGPTDAADEGADVRFRAVLRVRSGRAEGVHRCHLAVLPGAGQARLLRVDQDPLVAQPHQPDLNDTGSPAGLRLGAGRSTGCCASGSASRSRRVFSHPVGPYLHPTAIPLRPAASGPHTAAGTSPNSPRHTTGSGRPPVSAYGMRASPTPACDATTNLSRGFTAFPVHGKASPVFKENDGMHDTKCGQP